MVLILLLILMGSTGGIRSVESHASGVVADGTSVPDYQPDGTSVPDYQPDAEATFTDDFSAPLGDRWKMIQGSWKVQEGRLVHADASGAAHCRILANFPIREGIIEVEAIPREKNAQGFASIGLVGKYLDPQQEWWFRYGSYRRINIDGYVPGMDSLSLGSVLPELGRTYRLKLVMRNGLVGVCVDGTTIAIFRDPFADLAGRPGVFTETHAEFRNFKVTRFPEPKEQRLKLRKGSTQ